MLILAQYPMYVYSTNLSIHHFSLQLLPHIQKADKIATLIYTERYKIKWQN